MKNLKSLLKKSEPLIGMVITIPSLVIAEIAIKAGYQWLFIDLEHSSLSLADAANILQTARDDCSCIIRVPSNDETWIKRCLDLGPDGIIIPQVNSGNAIKQVIASACYPPLGTRSVGIGRAHDYGFNFDEYITSAHEKTAIIPQIEHIEAVNNLEEILAVKGIDGIFIGPYDLSGSMGMPGQVNHPEVAAKIAKVKQRASKIGVALGIFAASPDSASAYIKNGYTLIALGIDTMVFGAGVKDRIEQARKL
jgi:2-keto-3-deoxy-L-rhamnonate aldolase RhmA